MVSLGGARISCPQSPGLIHAMPLSATGCSQTPTPAIIGSFLRMQNNSKTSTRSFSHTKSILTGFLFYISCRDAFLRYDFTILFLHYGVSDTLLYHISVFTDLRLPQQLSYPKGSSPYNFRFHLPHADESHHPHVSQSLSSPSPL